VVIARAKGLDGALGGETAADDEDILGHAADRRLAPGKPRQRSAQAFGKTGDRQLAACSSSSRNVSSRGRAPLSGSSA
jgi:hypothetical protein